MAKQRVIATTLVSMAAAGCMAVGMMAVPTSVAYANTYSNLINAQNSRAQSQARESQLRSQLSGVSGELANKILELDDLTNNKIVAAQAKVTQANEAASSAKDEADAAAQRLQAAQDDKSKLEEEIKKTGEDYDDAHAAVAQIARDAMHGSSASDVMSMVTGSTSTQQFVNSMQVRDAVSRNESNAASDAAETLNTSQNRSQRLAAIEKQVATLKTAADEKASAAQSAAQSAQQERDNLDALRAQGEQQRNDLQNQVASLKSEVAKQAAQTVLLSSQVDAYNRQFQSEQAAASSQVSSGVQGSYRPATSSVSSSPSTSYVSSSPSASSGSGLGTSNGDYGNAYANGQCTYWAYQRRKQMGIGTPSYLGNGGQWYQTASRFGLRVDHSPEVGAALSFLPGQAGADGVYGHVAVVESVSGNTVTISEMNVRGLWAVSNRTLSNAGQYWYVH